MRDFKCDKKSACLRCGECCNIREKISIEAEEENIIKRALYKRTGVLYLYPFSRYTISISNDEAKQIRQLSKKHNISLSILPKKIFFNPQRNTAYVYDWFLDHDICPFFDGNCTIYESRPLICREFPVLKYDRTEVRDFCNKFKINSKRKYDEVLPSLREVKFSGKISITLKT